MIARRVGIALAPLLMAAQPLHAQPTIQVVPPVSVQARPGVTVEYLAVRRTIKIRPRNAVILFAGGNGLLNLQPDDSIPTGLSQNFLVRSRAVFAQQGLFVAVVDTPNQIAINGNVRLSADYAQEMGAVIQEVRGYLAHGGKVWLVGTSSGTISAASIAARFPHVSLKTRFPNKVNLRRPDGIVLTSTQTTLVSGQCGVTVFGANLAAINVPVLIAADQNDACPCSPPASDGGVLAALTHTNAKAAMTFSGGGPPQDPTVCNALTYHGFIGIEDTVVDAIAGWIATH